MRIKKKREFAAVVAAMALLSVLTACRRETAPGPITPTDVLTPIAAERTTAAVDGWEILPGVFAGEPFAYAGPFVEDGSDDEVDGIAAVVLTNRGGTDYRYLEFTVTTPSGALSFSASSVHAGTVTTVLNREKAPYTGEAAVSAECPVSVEYDAPPEFHEELFSLKQAPGSFSIENITGKDLPGTVTVYYKAADENGFLGGITFRTVIDGLKAGEEKWNPAGHMGRIVFVTYEE